MNRILQMNELKVTEIKQQTPKGHTAYKLEAPELETSAEQALFFNHCLQPGGLILRPGSSLASPPPPCFVGQFPVLRLGAVQPSGLPPFTRREHGPAGRSRPQVVELPRPVASLHAGGPNVLWVPIPSRPHSPLKFSRRVLFGKAGGEQQDRHHASLSRSPLTLDQRPHSGNSLGILTCPRGATSLVTDATLLQSGPGGEVESSWDWLLVPPIPMQ